MLPGPGTSESNHGSVSLGLRISVECPLPFLASGSPSALGYRIICLSPSAAEAADFVAAFERAHGASAPGSLGAICHGGIRGGPAAVPAGVYMLARVRLPSFAGLIGCAGLLLGMPVFIGTGEGGCCWRRSTSSPTSGNSGGLWVWTALHDKTPSVLLGAKYCTGLRGASQSGPKQGLG